jgi:hypothetical protein
MFKIQSYHQKMDRPTVTEYMIIGGIGHCCRTSTPSMPQSSPVACPPMTLLDLAVKDIGMVKTMKAVEPIEATITASVVERSQNTIRTTRVAKRLW